MFDRRRRHSSFVAIITLAALVPSIVGCLAAGEGGFRHRISHHPIDATVTAGETAAFSVILDTEFTSVSIGWERADGPEAEFTTIAGASGTVLQVGPATVEADDGARFRAVAIAFEIGDIPGDGVERRATSNVATLTVVPAPGGGEYRYVRVVQTSTAAADVAVDAVALEDAANDRTVFLAQVHDPPNGASYDGVLGQADNQCVGRPRDAWDETTYAQLDGAGGQIVASFAELARVESGQSLTVHVCSDGMSATWNLEVATSSSGPWVLLIRDGVATATVTVPNLPAASGAP